MLETVAESNSTFTEANVSCRGAAASSRRSSKSGIKSCITRLRPSIRQLAPSSSFPALSRSQSPRDHWNQCSRLYLLLLYTLAVGRDGPGISSRSTALRSRAEHEVFVSNSPKNDVKTSLLSPSSPCSGMDSIRALIRL
jgi:hypothetical protein